MAEPVHTITVYDPEGNPTQALPHEATRLFAERGFGVAGDRVNVVNNMGEVGTLDPAELQSFVAQGGRLASPEEFAQAQYEARNQGATESVRAFGESALRTLAPGLGAYALERAGVPYEEQRRREEASPVSRVAGQVAAFATGGRLLGLAAEAVGGGLAVAGRAAGLIAPEAEAAASTLGATGLATQATTQAAQGLSRTAAIAEGAVYGVGDYINEQQLQEHDITGEGLIISGIIGGAAGGLVSRLLGGRVSRAAARTAEEEAVPAATEAAEGVAAEVAGGAPKDVGALARYADNQAIEALNPSADIQGRLLGAPGDIARRRAVGDILLRRESPGIAAEAGREAVAPFRGALARTAEETARRTSVLLDETGQDIGRIISQHADEAVSPGAVSDAVESIASRIAKSRLQSDVTAANAFRSEFRRMLAEAEGAEGGAATDIEEILSGMAGSTESAYPVNTLRRVFDLRSAVGKKVKDFSRAPGTPEAGPMQRGLSDLYSELSRIERDTVERVVSPQNFADYVAAKRDYSILELVAEAAQARREAGPITGLGTATKVVSRDLGSIMRTNAGWIAARTADNAATGRMMRQVRDSVTSAADRAGVLAVRGMSRSAIERTATRMVSPKLYEQIAGQTYEAAQQESARMPPSSRMAVGGAPSVASVVARVHNSQVRFLASKLPTRGATDPLQAAFNIRTAPQRERDKFLRYVRGAADPSTFLRDVATHQLTPEGAEAAAALIPSVYARVREKVRNELLSGDAELSPSARRTIGILLGTRSGLSSPDNLAMLQSSYAAQGAAPQVSAPQARALSSGRFSFGRRSMSAADANQARMMGEGPGK